MATKAEKEKFSYVPTDDLYPAEDGEPMAASRGGNCPTSRSVG